MFESAKLKIERAIEHIEQLDMVFRAFVNENPHRITIQPNAETGKITAGVRSPQPLPRRLSTITGDAVHNLRTALDHIACELIRINGGTLHAFSGFPFHEDRANFEANFERKIKGASKKAICLIQRTELYNGGRGQGLWRLNKLDVADKHRTLLLAVKVTHLPKIVVRNPDGDAFATFEQCRVAGDGSINMASFPIDFTFEIENQDQAIVEIRFSNTEVLGGKDVIVTLKKQAQFVSGVIDIFERHADALID